jgi:protein BCP1
MSRPHNDHHLTALHFRRLVHSASRPQPGLHCVQVEVDIEFFDPKEADFHGIKTLLTDLLGGAEYDASQLADAVIAQVCPHTLLPSGPHDTARRTLSFRLTIARDFLQTSVGTVVKSGEDEDPIGVASVLSLHRYRDLNCLQQISAHVVQHCSDAKLKQQLTSVGICHACGNSTLSSCCDFPIRQVAGCKPLQSVCCVQVLRDAGTGLLLNQRLVNAPPQVAPPLMQALFDEISWAVEDEPTKARAVKTLSVADPRILEATSGKWLAHSCCFVVSLCQLCCM